jgi:hypothetical protein
MIKNKGKGGFNVDIDKLCLECRLFVSKYVPWDEKKVPSVAIVEFAECRKCHMNYQIYKGMIFSTPITRGV